MPGTARETDAEARLGCMVMALVTIVFAPMAVEQRRAARNERAQRARGAIEPAGDVYNAMRFAYPAAFAAMIGERFLRGPAPTLALVVGASLFAASKVLKWWAVLTLGDAWTFRVLVIPGERLVSAGPYRWLRHPNYVGVVGELVGTALMAGAAVAGPIATLAFGALIRRRIAVEEPALVAAQSTPAASKQIANC